MFMNNFENSLYHNIKIVNLYIFFFFEKKMYYWYYLLIVIDNCFSN